MAAVADEVVVTLVAKTDGFDAKMQGSSRGFQTAVADIGKAATSTEKVLDNLKKKMADALSAGDQAKATRLSSEIAQIEGALGRVNATSGRTRMGMQQLGFQMNDVATQMAMGTKATTIFAQQSGQMIQALQMMGGEGNAFLRFLGGPWGIGLSVAAVALTPLIGKLFDSSDAVGDLVNKLKEHAEKTKLSDQAQEAYSHTVEGSIAKVDELTKSLDEQNRTLEDNIELTKRATLAALTNVATNINAVSGQLAAAVADYNDAKEALKRAQSGAFGNDDGLAVATAMERVADTESRVRSLSGQLNALSDSANKASTAIRAVGYDLVERNAKEAVDPIARINRQYDDMAKKARAAGKYTQELADSIEKMRAADLKSAQAQKTNDRQSGRQIDFSQAESIARAAGLQVNSGYRSARHQADLYNDPSVNRPGNPVALPGSSAHNGANGKWAIDIQITDGVTPGKIRQIYAEQGVSLTKVLKEKGHFHIEGSRSEAAAADKAQERAAQQALQEQNRFEGLSGQLNDALLTAKRALIHGVEAQATAAEQQVRSDEERLDQSLTNQVEEGKLTAAHADALRAINQSIAAEKLRAIEIQRQVGLLQEADKDAEQAAGIQVDALKYQDEIARSQAEHRRIQLDIIDIVYQEKLEHLERLKLIAEGNGDIREANRLQGQIDALPSEKAAARGAAERGTMTPLQSFLHSIPQDAQEANEALEGLAVNGIRSVVDGLAQAGTAWIKLGGTAGKIINQIIGDLIRLVLYQQVVAPLMRMLMGGMSPGAAFVPVMGENINLTPSPSFPSVDIPHFASGGSGIIGGFGGTDNNLLSLNNDPIAWVSRGEKLTISNATAASGTGGAQGLVLVRIAASPYFDGRVLQVTGPVIAQASTGAAQGGASLARDNLARLRLHQLEY